MPASATAEMYFIAAMMILILVFAFAAIYIFIRQYRREIREKQERVAASKAVSERNRTAGADEKA